MVTHDSIKKIFHLYFGKHFSERGRKLFGRWLIAKINEQEKEEQLQHLWLITEGEVTKETKDDWKRLNRQMHVSSMRKIYIQWMKYAAVIVLFIISIVGTYNVAVQRTLRQPAEMTEIFVPYGESKEVILPDLSKVWLNAGSTLIYAKEFDKMASRCIYLTGEASFSVTKNKEKPFIVRTSRVDVEALGTVFTVEAYSNEHLTTATLEEGEIRVDLKDGKTNSYILSPNDQLVYSHLDGMVSLNKVDIANLQKKRKGYLIFYESSFLEIISTLERKYGVVFQYNSNCYKYNDELYNIKFLPDETIENVMSILQQLIGVDYKIIGKSIIIK